MLQRRPPSRYDTTVIFAGRFRSPNTRYTCAKLCHTEKINCHILPLVQNTDLLSKTCHHWARRHKGNGDCLRGQHPVCVLAQISLRVGVGGVLIAAAAHIFAAFLLQACPIFRPSLVCLFRVRRLQRSVVSWAIPVQTIAHFKALLCKAQRCIRHAYFSRILVGLYRAQRVLCRAYVDLAPTLSHTVP